MENESLKSAVIVAVALIALAIWLRRRYGSVREMWAGAMRRLNVSPQAVLKAVFVATALLWLAVWLFTSPAERAALKDWFYENSPFAPVVQPLENDAE
jgi:hypothetical protein